MIYVIGSLRNPRIPEIGNAIRELGYEVFDDWHAAGPNADDEWKRYEIERGRTYPQALDGEAATHVFDFDYVHLLRAQAGVLVYPAGKSSHLELGYLLGQGKRGYILLDQDPDRWDVMVKFATGVFFSLSELLEELGNEVHTRDGSDRAGDVLRQGEQDRRTQEARVLTRNGPVS